MRSNHNSDISSVDSLVEKYLIARQTCIVAFHQLCVCRPFHQPAAQAAISEALTYFCQNLVDYLSMGHFEFFEKIVNQIEKNTLSQIIPRRILPDLLKTTQDMLAFNDKYQDNLHRENLERDLSALGEHIAHRLELEDELIQLLWRTNAKIETMAKIA